MRISINLGFVALLIAGCASLGLEKPQGVKDQLGYVAANWTAATLTASDLCKRKVLTQAQCEQAETLSGDTGSAIGYAQIALNAGDLSTAQGKVNAALTALATLQQIIATKDTK